MPGITSAQSSTSSSNPAEVLIGPPNHSEPTPAHRPSGSGVQWVLEYPVRWFRPPEELLTPQEKAELRLRRSKGVKREEMGDYWTDVAILIGMWIAVPLLSVLIAEVVI